MNNLYEESKKVGDVGEEEAIRLLEKANVRILFRSSPDEYSPFFDLIAMNPKGKCYSIEVKNDRYNNCTVAIEFEHSGQPSGICISTAHFYMIYKSHYKTMFWISTEKLKRYITEKSPEWKKSRKSGSKSYMVPLDDFIMCKYE
jgi:Holliday junction resolvase-like predicted endonuclease